MECFLFAKIFFSEILLGPIGCSTWHSSILSARGDVSTPLIRPNVMSCYVCAACSCGARCETMSLNVTRPSGRNWASKDATRPPTFAASPNSCTLSSFDPTCATAPPSLTHRYPDLVKPRNFNRAYGSLIDSVQHAKGLADSGYRVRPPRIQGMGSKFSHEEHILKLLLFHKLSKFWCLRVFCMHTYRKSLRSFNV